VNQTKTLQGLVTKSGQMIRNVFAVCVEYKLRSPVAHEGHHGCPREDDTRYHCLCPSE